MTMKTLMAALALSTAITAPALAKPVSITANMSDYGGRGAYVAIYLTDAKGAYAGTVWVAGGKSKYHRHLTDWVRLSGGNENIGAVTGASVGAGAALTVKVDLADALFDAGYTLHMDAAVEDMRDSPNEIELPLTAAGNGQTALGRNYISDAQYAF